MSDSSPILFRNWVFFIGLHQMVQKEYFLPPCLHISAQSEREGAQKSAGGPLLSEETADIDCSSGAEPPVGCSPPASLQGDSICPKVQYTRANLEDSES